MTPPGASLAVLQATPGASPAGAPPILFWLALVIALATVAVTARSAAARAARWFALLLLGSAAILQLTAAGPLIRYQHFMPFSAEAAGAGRWALFALLVQLVLVVVGLGREGPDCVRWWRERWGGLRGVAVLLVFAGTAATLSASPTVYALELALATLAQLLQVVTLGLAVVALPTGWTDRAARWLTPSEEGPDRLPILLAAGTTVLAAVLAVVAYERHPHVPDEVVYLIQARTFASGALTLPLPPVPAGFDLDLMFTDQGRWYSPTPPGWPAVLAAGSLAGCEWLVNPLLAGVNVLLAYGLSRRLYDRPTARLTALLLAASPWHLFLAMSYMTHVLTLTCALVGGVGVARWRRGSGAGWLVLAGGAAGYGALIRPLDGLMLAAALGLWAVWRGPDGWRLPRLAGGAVAFGIGVALTGSLTLLYNRALTGDPLRFPIIAYTDQVYGPGTNAMGFGPDRGLGWSTLDPFPGHGWRDVLVNTNLNAFQVNVELTGWATGSLVVLALFLFRRAPRPRETGLLLAAGLVVGLHALYWFSGGPDFGARYWFLLIFPLLVLTARGVLLLDGETPRRGHAVSAAAALILVTLLTFIPWRAMDKYHHYRRMRPDARALADSAGFGRSLVLVQARRFPDYAGAAIYNPLDLRADQPIYAFDRDSAVRAELLAAYPDRPRWVVLGPSVTGGAYRILAGPLPPGAPLPPPPEVP